MSDRPPIYTATVQLVDWTLGRTADIPKSQRFTFGQRVDNLTLDALMLIVEAIYSKGDARRQRLSALNLTLEKLRVLWRLVQVRGWISQQQLLHVNGLLDEIQSRRQFGGAAAGLYALAVRSEAETATQGDALGFCGAGPGTTTIPGICCRRTATTTIPTIATITSVFVVCWRCPLPRRHTGAMRGGKGLFRRSQEEASLTCVPVPRGRRGKDAAPGRGQ